MELKLRDICDLHVLDVLRVALRGACTRTKTNTVNTQETSLTLKVYDS